MGHTSQDNLNDLASVLEKLRSLGGMKEPKPGIFYLKSKPFLHFHDADGKRWADVKDGDSWGEPIEISFGAKKLERDNFYKEVQRRHEKITTKAKSPRKANKK